MKLAVFACADYYPDGGASDFIGFALNGTAEEIAELLRRAEIRQTSSADVFSLLDCDTGQTSGAEARIEDGVITIQTYRTSSALALVELDALDPELLEAFKKLPNVTVDESS